MNLNSPQKKCSQIVKKIDKKYQIKRDSQLTVAQLMEELGELVEKINYKRLRQKTADKKELEDEFADVLILLAQLAEEFDVDIEKAVNKKLEILRKKHGL